MLEAAAACLSTTMVPTELGRAVRMLQDVTSASDIEAMVRYIAEGVQDWIKVRTQQKMRCR